MKPKIITQPPITGFVDGICARTMVHQVAGGTSDISAFLVDAIILPNSFKRTPVGGKAGEIRVEIADIEGQSIGRISLSAAS